MSAAGSVRRVPAEHPTISEAVAAARGGDTILVAPGRYPESVRIEGKSITIQGESADGEVLVIGRRAPSFVLVGTGSELRGMTVRVGGPFESQRHGSRRVAIAVQGGHPTLCDLVIGTDPAFRHVYEVPGGTGVLLTAQAHGMVTRCRIEQVRTGLEIEDGSCPVIEHSEIVELLERHDGEAFGMIVRGADSAPVVRGNRLLGRPSFGIAVYDGAAPRLEGNEIEGGWRAILFINAGDAQAEANRIDGGADGIYIENSRMLTITANVITGATTGIWAEDSSLVIEGNTITGSGEHGIFLSDCQVTIENNTISGSGTAALAIWEGDTLRDVPQANESGGG